MTDLETLSALIDGDLGAAEANTIQARLAAEPELATLLAELTAFDQALSAYPEPTPPLALNAAVLGAGAATGVSLTGWILTAVLLGAAVVVLRLGVHTPPVPPPPTAPSTGETAPVPPAAEGPAVRRVRAAVPARNVTEAECADFETLSHAAIDGFLTVEQQACLEGYRLGADIETAAFASDLLLVQAWAAGDMETWRALAVDHVSAIEPDRAVLMYKLAIDAAKAGDQAIALSTAEDALALPEAFDPLDRNDHLNLMHRIRVAALADQDYPHEQIWQAASEWYDHNRAAGLEATTAERVCVAYGTSCAE